jgi:RimJ/RimL family protein N-acetyltransferase
MNAFAFATTSHAATTTVATPPPFPWVTRDEVFRIETPRLWLRWSRPRDANRLQAIAGQKDVAEMTASWPHPLPAGEAALRIDRSRHLNADGNALILAVTLKGAPDRLIGQIGCNAIAAEQLGIGYMLDPGLAGGGLATEAVGGFVHALLTYTHIDRIGASSRTNNPASRRVLEKSGFEFLRTGSLETTARGILEVDFFELCRKRWKRNLEASRRALEAANGTHAMASRDISQSASDKIPI